MVVDVTSVVDNQKTAVGARLKEARAALGLTQKELCALIEKPLPSLRDYELGKSMPGGEAVAALVRAGVNANWLLTGHGPMLWNGVIDLAASYRDSTMLTNRRWAIVCYALHHVDPHWFSTVVSEQDHGLNKIVDDYNAGRILNDEVLRRAIPSITIEDLAAWGREALAWRARLEYSPLRQDTPTPKINIDALEAIIEGALKVAKNAPAGAIAAHAASVYAKCIEDGLITPEGIGDGKMDDAV